MKNIFTTYQVRPPNLIHSLSIVQLDVQVLIDALQRPPDLDFVLELYSDFVLDKRLEETALTSVQYAWKRIGVRRWMMVVMLFTVVIYCAKIGIAHLKKSILVAVSI